MTSPRLRIEGGKVMIYEVGAVGHEDDPWNDPVHHVASIYYYSEWDTYQVAPGYPIFVPIAHPTIAPAAAMSFGPVYTPYAARTSHDWVLVTHNLGYKPRIAIIDEVGNLLPPAWPIQRISPGGHRSVCVCVTSTQVLLREFRAPGNVTLPAINKTYQLIAFRQPVAVSGAPVADLRPSRTRLGHDKLDSNIASMRLAKSGETGFLVPLGVTLDIANGQGRWVIQDGTTVETSSLINGAASGYTGSFTGSPALELVVQ